MEVFRLCRKKFGLGLSGKGAALKGARWNSAGTELIYTASNRSLAMAEVAVHFTLATLPPDYQMMTIYIPDRIKLYKIDFSELPDNWNEFPHPAATQAIGDEFVSASKQAVLQVPSAVTAGDYNLLLNPNHSQFSGIRVVEVQSFPFDKRIFR